MKLLLISSVNLTTNPRIYKELQLAYRLQYEITFVGFNIGNWSDAGDAAIKEQFPGIQFIYLDATRKNYFSWLYYSLLHVACKFLWPLNKKSLFLTVAAHSKRAIQLQNLFKTFNRKYDLIIGHTLPTLYPALKLAKKIDCKFAFDVEDYHPGEEVSIDVKNEICRKEILLQRILPSAHYVSAASSLIGKYIYDLSGRKPVTVLNSFPRSEFIQPALPTTGKLQLIWFSQNISKGRGLELILPGWKNLQQFFELTLIGNLHLDFYNSWIKGHTGIIIKEPMMQTELHRDLSNYDIGLATEPGKDLNNKLALSNKIHAYLQAGLFILATDTPAQFDFMGRFFSHGVIVQQNATSMYNSLMNLSGIKESIRNGREERFKNASVSSWESESAILQNEWQQLTNKI